MYSGKNYQFLFQLLFVTVFSTEIVNGSNDIVIMVNKDSHISVEDVAFCEKQVNFWDADLTNGRACTECFAAIELKKFLIKVTDIKEGDIAIAGVKSIPKEGNVFILGSSGSNPLVNAGTSHFELDQSFKMSAKKRKWSNHNLDIKDGSEVSLLASVYEYFSKLYGNE